MQASLNMLCTNTLQPNCKSPVFLSLSLRSLYPCHVPRIFLSKLVAASVGQWFPGRMVECWI